MRNKLLTLVTLTSSLLAGQQTQKPNIIIILADDMGYSDPGCFGGEINTPNIDALANNGMRFTQFYNNARCCPTRAPCMRLFRWTFSSRAVRPRPIRFFM